MIELLLICALLSAILLYREAKAHRSVKVGLPEGPCPLISFLGNAWTVYELNANPGKICERLACKYGDLVTIWIGRWPAIIINSPEAAYELLQKRAAATSSRPTHNTFRQDSCPDRVVFAPAGENFRYLRKIYHSLLQKQQASKVRQFQDEESIYYLWDLTNNPDRFRFSSDRFAINVIFRSLYDQRLDQKENPQIVEIYKIWAMMYLYFAPGSLPVDFFPILTKLPVWMQPWEWLLRLYLQRESTLHRRHLKHLKDSTASESVLGCFAKALLARKGTNTIPEEAMLNILAMVLGAGSDTVSAVLQLFFKAMAMFPDKVSKAQLEIDDIVGCDRLPGWEDWKSLRYTRALIKELHRWAPIAILGLPHATTEDIEYRGYRIPKGTILMPNIFSLSRHEQVYQNPDDFEPCRYLDDDCDSSTSALHSDYRKRDHFQYGFGRRLCPGVHVAEASLYLAIVRILWAFDIRAIPGCHLSMKHQRSGLIKKPLPFRVSITRRDIVRINLVGKKVDSMVNGNITR